MKPPLPNAHVNRLIALTLLLLIFSGTLGLGAVWVRQEISQTANRSRALVAKVADIERRIDEVSADIAAAVNPHALLQQNETMRLGLVSPRESQVVRLQGSPELRLLTRSNERIMAEASVSGDTTPRFRIVTASASLR